MSNEMQEIERAAKAFASARDELAERMQRLQDEQEAIKRRLMQGLRNAVARMRAEYDQLVELVRAHPELFEKPKTRTLHGIRLGWMKQRGRMEIEDPDQVCALVRKLFPEQADALLRVSTAPNKAALAELPVRDLKRLGVAVHDDTEAPFVKPADSELDKLISALLSDPELEKAAS